MRKAHKILIGNPERKTPAGGPRRRWEDNIKNRVRGYEEDSYGSG
jgi:hypothetical protein